MSDVTNIQAVLGRKMIPHPRQKPRTFKLLPSSLQHTHTLTHSSGCAYFLESIRRKKRQATEWQQCCMFLESSFFKGPMVKELTYFPLTNEGNGIGSSEGTRSILPLQTRG